MKPVYKHLLLPIFVIASCLLFAPSNTASADMGPKDQVTIYVDNAPDELYYLDLLTQTPGTYENIREEERASLNETMLKKLSTYEADGWYPAYTGGTGAPMWGNLVGIPSADGKQMVHTYTYFGVPDTYRIIIVTESGIVTVSDVFKREVLQSTVNYNYITSEAKLTPTFISYLVQFLSTCIPTLLIEGIILLLFGFKLKENWKVFLFTNLITQVVLTLSVGIAMIKEGTVLAYLVMIPVEFLILVAETLVYDNKLKGKTRKRCVTYGFIANLASCVAGFLMIPIEFDLLSRL